MNLTGYTLPMLRPLTLLLILTLSACSVPPGGPPHLQKNPPAPPDFALGLSLVGLPPADDGWRRPVWYLVEPDSRLRAAVGERTADSPTPPIVRQLDAVQVNELWHLAANAGLIGAAPGGADVPPAVPAAPTAV